MKRIVLFAAALLIGASALAQNEYNYQKRSLFELLPIHSKDIVFLGNSITDGGEWAELFDNPHIKNRGISADRASWLLDRLDPIIAGQPKKLFLMIGTNDLAAGAQPAEVALNVGKLIDRFRKESPRTELYIQSILPVNGSDELKTSFKKHFEKGAEVSRTNDLLKALCAEKGVTYLDVYSVLANEKGLLDKKYTNDGLHLMGAGYLVWKSLIEDYVK